MNLDWDFYYDSWLIDKVEDGFTITVSPDVKADDEGYYINDKGKKVKAKLKCVPDHLDCYFGANPIYLYGEGKLWHECIVSPVGIAVYPIFLKRPGFEWVNRSSFSVKFDRSLDFWGNSVIDKHKGRVNATRFIKSTLKSLYGVDMDDYVGENTPSVTTTIMTSSQGELVAKTSYSEYQIFSSGQDMINKGCVFYCRMFVESGRSGPYEMVRGVDLPTYTPGDIIQTPGIFTDVLFTKYSYVKIPKYYEQNLFTTDEWTIMFRTNINFRPGVVVDFGASRMSDTDQNTGLYVEVQNSHLELIMNDGPLRLFDFLYDDMDFRFPHNFVIHRDSEMVRLIVDGEELQRFDCSDVGVVSFSPSLDNYISKYSISNRISSMGDIEELTIFNGFPEEVIRFGEVGIPLLKKGGVEAIVQENIPHSLPYGLTYSKPTDFYIPNHFKSNFYKYYLKNKDNVVLVAGADTPLMNESYRGDLEPYEDMSLKIPNGFNVDTVITAELDGTDTGEKVEVLTKLTSDVHNPLHIRLDFTVPEYFYDPKVTYSMKLRLKGVEKMLWYSYKRFKTGEWV